MLATGGTLRLCSVIDQIGADLERTRAADVILGACFYAVGASPEDVKGQMPVCQTP